MQREHIHHILEEKKGENKIERVRHAQQLSHMKKTKKVKDIFNMERCNYSEKLNPLQAQKCNVHLCHHLAMGESLFEQIPLQID